VKGVFRQKWQPLHARIGAQDLCHPGIYVLAYSSLALENTTVDVRNVLYVGMSTSSLAARLKQFHSTVEGAPSRHGAAERFIRDWTGAQQRYIHNSNRFFVATVRVPCEPRKHFRSPGDLETLGFVAALEYHVIAKIRRDLDLEPPLNKK
jgi:hypothetical protein